MSRDTSETAKATIAPYPFDLTSADIVLRTSDFIDFHVQTPFLTLASPVFKDMLSLPQPNQGERTLDDACPVVNVAEDSKTLETLLRLCYPTNKPALDDLEHITLVLKAALKYDMEWMVPLLSKDLKGVVSQNPLKAWAVACRTASEDVAHEAASKIRDMSDGDTKNQDGYKVSTPPLILLGDMLQDHGEGILTGVCAGDYYRLRQFLLIRKESCPSFTLLKPSEHAAKEQESPKIPWSSTSLPHIGPADIILQCSEGIKYRAHSFVLLFHSDRLRKRIETAMDTVPYATADVVDGEKEAHHPLPVLSLDIGSETLCLLLGLFYGTTKLPDYLRVLAAALVATNKYGLSQAEKLVQARWDELVKQDALEAYFVAIEHDLKTCAQAAAKVVLKNPIRDAYARPMETTPALAYHRLLRYYGECAKQVDDAIRDRIAEWSYAICDIRPVGIVVPTRIRVRNKETRAYLTGMLRAQAANGPAKALDLETQDLLRKFSDGSASLWPERCSSICSGVMDAALKLAGELPRDIEKAISGVKLEIP